MFPCQHLQQAIALGVAPTLVPSLQPEPEAASLCFFIQLLFLFYTRHFHAPREADSWCSRKAAALHLDWVDCELSSPHLCTQQQDWSIQLLASPMLLQLLTPMERLAQSWAGLQLLNCITMSVRRLVLMMSLGNWSFWPRSTRMLYPWIWFSSSTWWDVLQACIRVGAEGTALFLAMP